MNTTALAITNARKAYAHNRRRWLAARYTLRVIRMSDSDARPYIIEMEQAMRQMIGSFTRAMILMDKPVNQDAIQNKINRDLCRWLLSFPNHPAPVR